MQNREWKGMANNDLRADFLSSLEAKSPLEEEKRPSTRERRRTQRMMESEWKENNSVTHVDTTGGKNTYRY